MLNPVSTGIDDHFLAGRLLSIQPVKPTQPPPLSWKGNELQQSVMFHSWKVKAGIHFNSLVD